jgi:hypothetical protein
VRHVPGWLVSASILAVFAAACNAVGGGQATPQPVFSSPTPAVPQPSRVPVLNPSPDSSSAAEAQAIDAAMRDAAGRLSLASGAGDIHVQQIEAQQWPDSSLGCPREGVFYSQVVTPGYLVVISAAGKQLEYHADSRGRIVFCQEL